MLLPRVPNLMQELSLGSLPVYTLHSELRSSWCVLWTRNKATICSIERVGCWKDRIFRSNAAAQQRNSWNGICNYEAETNSNAANEIVQPGPLETTTRLILIPERSKRHLQHVRLQYLKCVLCFWVRTWDVCFFREFWSSNKQVFGQIGQRTSLQEQSLRRLVHLIKLQNVGLTSVGAGSLKKRTSIFCDPGLSRHHCCWQFIGSEVALWWM